MGRNRFQLLLRYMHFANNQDPQENEDWLIKVRIMLEIPKENFTKTKTLYDTIVIDESMVPWRSRLLYRQYNSRKAHKYGVKIYKLCDPVSYTYTSSVYVRKKCFCTQRPNNRDHHF